MANTLKVKLEGTNVLTQSVLNGVDISNKLANGSGIINSSTPFVLQATDDCFIMLGYVCGTPQSFHIYLDNEVFDFMPSSQTNVTVCAGPNGSITMPLKKNQTIKIERTGTSGSLGYVYNVYGLKRV